MPWPTLLPSVFLFQNYLSGNVHYSSEQKLLCTMSVLNLVPSKWCLLPGPAGTYISSRQYKVMLIQKQLQLSSWLNQGSDLEFLYISEYLNCLEMSESQTVFPLHLFHLTHAQNCFEMPGICLSMERRSFLNFSSCVGGQTFPVYF